MTVVKHYNGINHELLCDLVCDFLLAEGFRLDSDVKDYDGEKSAFKVHIFGKRRNGFFSSERVKLTIIGQLDAYIVLTFSTENEYLEERVKTELDTYFQRLESPDSSIIPKPMKP